MAISSANLAELLNLILGMSKEATPRQFTSDQLTQISAQIASDLAITDLYPAATINAYIIANIATLDDVAGIHTALENAGWSHA